MLLRMATLVQQDISRRYFKVSESTARRLRVRAHAHVHAVNVAVIAKFIFANNIFRSIRQI